MENRKFGNIMKIIKSLKKVNDEEAFEGSEALTFIKVKSVNKKNLPVFVKDLEKFSTKLDEAVELMFRNGSGPDLKKEYENIIKQIKEKQDQLLYLSSYIETTQENIDSAEKTLEDYKKKLEEADARKRRLDENMKNLRKSRQDLKRTRKRSFKDCINQPTPWSIVRNSSFKHKNQGDIILRLEPIGREAFQRSANKNDEQDEEDEDILDEEDWVDEGINDDW